MQEPNLEQIEGDNIAACIAARTAAGIANPEEYEVDCECECPIYKTTCPFKEGYA